MSETDKIREKAPNVLLIEAVRSNDCHTISAYESIDGAESSIRHYEQVRVSLETLAQRSRQVVETLNKANRRGHLSRELLVKLRETGQLFYDELFTIGIKEKIKGTSARYLSLHLDDRLVHIPWEILNDGEQFLCERFNVGRFVKTRQSVPGAKNRILTGPLKMFIIADPTGKLGGAYEEGIQLRNYMDRTGNIVNASFQSEGITPDFLRQKMRNFDVVHFAGHADYNQQNPGLSGWRLSRGILRAKDIQKMAGGGAMPSLIFSNACQSARTEEWGLNADYENNIFGLANAFLLAGVKHYVGTFWEILDEPSRHFAIYFYNGLISGMTIGEAIREARYSLIEKYGENTIVWASYVLYGDPTSNYMEHVKNVDSQKETSSVNESPREVHIRSEEEVINFEQADSQNKRHPLFAAVAGVALSVLLVLVLYPTLKERYISRLERKAFTYYKSGALDDALRISRDIEEKDPAVRVPYLIQGDIDLIRGKLDDAEVFYKKAIDAGKGTNLQKARAFAGLGRLASIRNKMELALNYYKKAAAEAPKSSLGYLPQAILFERKGNNKLALDLVNKAKSNDPDNLFIGAIAADLQRRVALSRDKARQARIDEMIKELIERKNSAPAHLQTDNWTSGPLTIWVMDFERTGYSLHEGEGELLATGIARALLKHSRAHLVERDILDRLLKELKLGTSTLADPKVALSLGKIIAARVILHGQIIYSGSECQISIRMIETETGRIRAAVSEAFERTVPISVMASSLSEKLIDKITRIYPLKGRIIRILGRTLELNIGDNVGVHNGQLFKGMERGAVLQIVSVQPEKSFAKALTENEFFHKGERVKEQEAR